MASRSNKSYSRANRILRLLAGGYVIVFLPLILSYFGLLHFTAFSGRMLLYALIPLAIVLLILFAIYVVRVFKAGYFWTERDKQTQYNSLHNTEK